MPTNPRTLEDPLAWLLAPVTPQRCFDEFYERKPLVLERSPPQPDFYAGLLTLEGVDRAVTSLGLSSDNVTLVSAAREITAADYAQPDGPLDAARVFELYRQGATIVLQQLHVTEPSLAHLCRGLEARFSARFQVNVYVTPPAAQGFKTHFDSHDVFVLQAHGSKCWTLYDTPVALPPRGEPFSPGAFAPGPASREFTLRAGDLAYVPRGVMHDALCTDEPSVHLTVGVLSTTWADLLVEAVSRACLEEPSLRRSLPPDFARDGFDPASVRDEFRLLLGTVLERADLARALGHFADDLVHTRVPLLEGQLAQSQRAAAVTSDTPVQRRPHVLLRTERTDDALRIAVYGRVVTVPAHAAEPALALLRGERCTARALPGPLDEAGRVALVQRLVGEGVLALV